MKIRKIQPAFAQPWMSVRRKMSEKIAMKIQIARMRKNTSIDQMRKSPKLFMASSSSVYLTDDLSV